VVYKKPAETMHRPAAKQTRLRQRVILGLSLWISGTVAAAITAQVSADKWPLPSRLREYIERTTGSEAVDCGQLGAVPAPPDDTNRYIERQITCGAAAIKAKKAFWAIQWHPSLDSSACTGLVADREGTIYRFSYDSAPCGGPGCSDRFSLERCPVPAEVNHALSCSSR
jgi:hypothetical protein